MNISTVCQRGERKYHRRLGLHFFWCAYHIQYMYVGYIIMNYSTTIAYYNQLFSLWQQKVGL